MKKSVSLFLALLLCVSLAFPAAAEGTYAATDPTEDVFISLCADAVADATFPVMFAGETSAASGAAQFRFSSGEGLEQLVTQLKRADATEAESRRLSLCFFDKFLPCMYDDFVNIRVEEYADNVKSVELGTGEGYFSRSMQWWSSSENQYNAMFSVSGSNGEFLRQLSGIADQAKAASNTTRGRLEFVNDYVMEIATYGYPEKYLAREENGQKIYWSNGGQSAKELLEEGLGVCASYTYLTNYLCFLLGIPSIVLQGADHVWNMVYVDGAWKMLDVTWNDAPGNRTRYFLVDTISDSVHDITVYDDAEAIRLAEKLAIAVQQRLQALEAARQAAASVAGFHDVTVSDYFADAVQWAVDHNPQITKGTAAATFSPSNTVTRGEAVTFLWRAMGEPEPTSDTNPFSDVKENKFYYKAVLWAVEEGITNGTGADTFSPNTPVTRGSMIAFLWRAEGKPGDSGSKVWYADPEAWAGENGLLTGTAQSYSTGGACPRCDVVYYLWKDMAA